MDPSSDDTDWPSGPWIGYYVHRGVASRHRQDLNLSFKDGIVRGSGVDDVAPFTLRGRYDRETRVVTWTKTYLSHEVSYRGFREGRGIWGTWEIAVHTTGGFMIWPRAAGLGESMEVELEVKEPVAGPASPGAQRLE